MNSRSNYKQFY